MARTLTGFVCYPDDGLYFRQVLLQAEDDDAVLQDPQWVTFGCDPTRTARLDTFPISQPESWPQLTGTP